MVIVARPFYNDMDPVVIIADTGHGLAGGLRKKLFTPTQLERADVQRFLNTTDQAGKLNFENFDKILQDFGQLEMEYNLEEEY